MAYTDDEGTLRLLVSNLEESKSFSLMKLQDDFFAEKSAILTAINSLLTEKIKQGSKDLKTLNLIFEFLANIVSSGDCFAQKVVNETCILLCVEQLVEAHRDCWHADILTNIYRLLEHLL